jgi:hypothetical protein
MNIIFLSTIFTTYFTGTQVQILLHEQYEPPPDLYPPEPPESFCFETWTYFPDTVSQVHNEPAGFS